MAHRSSSSVPKDTKRVPYDPRKLTNGSPQKGPKPPRPMTNNISKTVSCNRTGDAVSDESENEQEAEGTPEEDSDSDEADAFALSGAYHTTSRLAGTVGLIEADTVAGAEEELDSDEENYDYDDLDNEEEDDEADGMSLEKAVEKELIKEYEETRPETGARKTKAASPRPQTATSVSNEMTGLSLVEDNALARRLSLQSEDSNGGLDWSEDPFQGLQTNDSLYQELIEDAEDDFSYDLASWRVTDETIDEDNLFELQPTGNEKRVRFAETVSSRSSSMSSEEDPRDAYPDLFDGASTSQNTSQYMMDIDTIDDDNESHFDFDYADEHEQAAIDIEDDEESELDGETSSDCMHNVSCH